MSLNRRIEAVLITIGFIMTGICAGAMIYMADEGRNTLDGIFRMEYIIPLAVYSAGVMAISYLLFHFIKKWMVEIPAFLVSVAFGVPTGIILMNQIIKWSIYLYNWIDILMNVY
ncbi:MAG: hypothetical protein JW723_01430 [Bacteroidales bacterium]|nr:hypothetical protein [Bacteroidales bacterium]